MSKRQFISMLESRATFFDLFRRPPQKKVSSGTLRFGPPGRYEVARKLGQGASGAVYQVWDNNIKRHVAIKVSEMKSNDILTEAQSAGRLKHPNIVAIHDAVEDGEVCYVTMEYVEGTTLREFCQKDNLLPLKRVSEVILSVCDALDYAHRQGVIHRDIKPSNIMLDQEGAVKISDFGIAQMTEKTVRFGIYGTPSYMSPEQLKDEEITVRSDIFSLGCVLYELLTGKQAFRGDNCFASLYQVIHGDPEPISALRPEVPPILEMITRKAMEKDPFKRYGGCSELAHDLGVALRGLVEKGKQEKVKGVVDFALSLPFFEGFTREQVKDLLSASRIMKVRAGRVIMAEGEISDTFHIILKGRVKVRRDHRDIAFVEAGECFGEMACIGGQARTADVVADNDCILIKIRATLLDKSSESVQLLFYKTFARTLVRRLSKGSEKEGSEANFLKGDMEEVA